VRLVFADEAWDDYLYWQKHHKRAGCDSALTQLRRASQDADSPVYEREGKTISSVYRQCSARGVDPTLLLSFRFRPTFLGQQWNKAT
jgi:hypothetical protein